MTVCLWEAGDAVDFAANLGTIGVLLARVGAWGWEREADEAMGFERSWGILLTEEEGLAGGSFVEERGVCMFLILLVAS